VERGKKKPSQARAKKLTQKATKQELLTHRITNTKTNPHKQPFVIHSHALTAANEQTLSEVKQDATDALGQTISSSAVVRACLCFLAKQPSGWIAKELHPLIEEEIAQGRLWGTTRRR